MRVALAAFAIALGTAVFRIPSLTEPAWYYDEGVFTAVAWTMSKGVTLYSGVYDLQPPGIYWLYRVLLALGGQQHHLVEQIAATLAVVATALLTLEIGRRWLSLPLAALAAALTAFALSIPTLDGDLLNVELAALPFFLASLLLAFSRRLPPMFVSGVLLGVALAIRPSFAIDALALLILLLSSGPKLARLLSAGLGLLAAGTMAIAALWAQGALEPYLTVVLPSDHTYALRANYGTFVPLFVRLAVFAIIGGAALAVAKSLPGRVMAVWIPASLAGATLTPLEYTHYAHEAIPPIAIGLVAAMARLRWRWGALVPGAAVALVLCAELVLILPAQQSAIMQSQPGPRPLKHNIGFEHLPDYYANWFVYAFGAESTAQYDAYFSDAAKQKAEVEALQHVDRPAASHLIVLGSRPWIYIESGLLPATRFVATCSKNCIVPSEPDEIRASLDRGCADVVVAVSQLGEWQADLDAGGYVRVADAPWPTYLPSRPPPPCG